MLKLIWDFLKTGIMEDGIYRHSTLGTPQGGIVSPVLANIYLDRLDQWAKKWTDLSRNEKRERRKKGKGNWEFVRYADDFLFLTNGTRGCADNMRERIGDFANEELNLSLSEKKTEIVHASDGFEFLGYELQLTKKGGVRMRIPEEAKKDLRSKVKQATDGGTEISVRRKIGSLNAVLRGWANYYKYAGDAANVFASLDYFTWRQVTSWLAQKHKCTAKRLVSRILESANPLRVDGVTLYTMSGDSDAYTESMEDKPHPYLEDSGLERESLPEDDPDLANSEEREGWRDARWEALQRDNWTCQECGKDLGAGTAQVHHKRPNRGYESSEEANRLENLKSLCPNCHIEIEKKRLCH